MRAKFINEIKIGKEGTSPLSSVGVGDIGVFIAYDEVKKEHNDVFNYFEPFEQIASKGSPRNKYITDLFYKIRKNPYNAVWANRNYLNDQLSAGTVNSFYSWWGRSPNVIKVELTGVTSFMFYDKDIKMGQYIEDSGFSNEQFFFLLYRL